MDYTQNPFLRGDDYSLEVADLRDDINELATDISQINITLTDDIRDVDERLNVYQNDIKNNVYTNQLEANIANINNANIDYVFANNIKTNVLDVNVLNVASINNTVLANPHIENIDAVNGQILNAEIKNSVIVNGSGSFDSLNTNTINIESGSIKRANIADSTLTNVVINGFDLNNPRYLNVNNADFNVANFDNIYGINANFYYIERVNTDNVRTTNIVVNGDARFHIINADSANIKSIDATTISNAVLSNVKIKSDLVLTSNIKVNGVDANFINVKDLRAKAISVQELTDVNLIHANNVSSDWGYIQNFAAHNLTLDVSAQPKETPYVLGYDANGKVFPAIAQGGGGGGSAVLPSDADYIYTDAQGLPLKGVAATDLNDSNALVKASLVAPLSNKIDELTEMLSVLDELKPNQTVDYFNSTSPLDYRSITSFETNKVSIKDKNNYTIVADGVLGFTGLKVDNNVLHLDSTLSNFKYNADLSYMFNGCTNFNGTGFDVIPEGTTNTAYMFADTKIKRPYVLPASVVNSDNMYQNVLFETTPGETIDGYSDITYSVNNNTNIGLNIINSKNIVFDNSTDTTLTNVELNIVNSSVGLGRSSLYGININGGNIYADNVVFTALGNVRDANITLKGDISGGTEYDFISNCEVNAVAINGWDKFNHQINYGNVYIGENTPVKAMFDGSFEWPTGSFPNVIYPYVRTNWAGLYYGANGYNQDFLNEILPTASNVDEMFYNAYNKNLFNNKDNILNVLNVLNKDITSLYKFCDGPNSQTYYYAYDSLSELKAAFPNVKNIGYSNLVRTGLEATEEDIFGFTDISGYMIRPPAGATTFNVPTLTTLVRAFSQSTNNVNIVVSNNCTFAPNVYNREYNVFLTGDLSGIKNGYYLYPWANQWFGYPENLESAQYMYSEARFSEISEPIPNGLTNTAGMFMGGRYITSVPSGMNLSNCIDASNMFRGCWSLTNIDFNFLKTLKPGANISSMFERCNNLIEIPGVMDLSNCGNAQSMFNDCSNLTSVDFNFLKTLKPGADISYMFNGCYNLAITDFNIFTWIPEGVIARNWFVGKLACDINTNNESIISMLNGQNIDGNVDISLVRNNYKLNVINNKALNVDIDITSLSDGTYGDYRLTANKYNLSIKGTSTQGVGIKNLGYNISNSYFEASNCGNIRFDGDGMSRVENSRFVFRNIDNACINGQYRYGGPLIYVYNSSIELNNVSYLKLTIMDGNNIHINQMPKNGFDFNIGIIVDSPANIDILDRQSFLNNVTFIDNRLNINVLNNVLALENISNVLGIYLNSAGSGCNIRGNYTNVIIHIPTNAVLATGLNNGTYGSFPNENIIQY